MYVPWVINNFWHTCFPVNFAKFLRTLFLQNTSGQLILKTASICKNKSILFLWSGLQIEIIFRTQMKSSIFQKILFTENNETNKELIHSCFLWLLQMELSLIDVFDYAIKPKMQISLLGAKNNQPKTQAAKSAPNTGQDS